MVQSDDGGFFGVGSDGLHYAKVVKTDEYGKKIWSLLYGVSSDGGSSIAHSVIRTSDGGYAVTGYMWQGTTQRAEMNIWLIKFSK